MGEIAPVRRRRARGVGRGVTAEVERRQGSALKPAGGFAARTPSKGRGPLQSVHWVVLWRANRDRARSMSALLKAPTKLNGSKACPCEGGEPLPLAEVQGGRPGVFHPPAVTPRSRVRT